MKRRHKMKKEILRLLLGGVLCAGVMGTQFPSVHKTVELQEMMKYTSMTETEEDLESETSEDGEVTSDFESGEISEYIEDENILFSEYYAYGQGCLFVTIEKDTDTYEETEESEDITSETEEDVTLDTDTAEEEESETGTDEQSEEEETATEEADTEKVVNSMENTGIVSSVNLVEACLTKEEQLELVNGANKELRVTIRSIDESKLKSNKMSSLHSAENELEDYSFGECYRFTIRKKEADGTWKKISKFYKDLEIFLDIPSELQEKNAEYSLIQLEKEGYNLIPDTDNYGVIMTVKVDSSSELKMCYKTKGNKKVETTPAPVEKKSFWTKLNEDEFCLWHWFDFSILIIAITWIVAINGKKARTIFMAIMSVITITNAIMGHCGWDWPLAVGVIILMVLVYIWKEQSMKSK